MTTQATPHAEEQGGPIADTDFDAALASVRHAIEKAKTCSDAERAALVGELEQLHDMAAKLESGRVEIVVFGEISTGKSAMINALVGQAVANVNVRGGWTKDVWHLSWDGSGYCLPGFADSQVVLIDTRRASTKSTARTGPTWHAKPRRRPTSCCS
jgi:ribosome biogenesis GTPase A